MLRALCLVSRSLAFLRVTYRPLLVARANPFGGSIWYHPPVLLPPVPSFFPFFLETLFLLRRFPQSPWIMPFFENLRRRSRASFRSNDSKSNESHSNGDMTSGKSSSTLDTASSSITPPSSVKPNGASSPNLPALNESASAPPTLPPQRPGPYVTSSQRLSTFVCDVHWMPLSTRLVANCFGVVV